MKQRNKNFWSLSGRINDNEFSMAFSVGKAADEHDKMIARLQCARFLHCLCPEDAEIEAFYKSTLLTAKSLRTVDEAATAFDMAASLEDGGNICTNSQLQNILDDIKRNGAGSEYEYETIMENFNMPRMLIYNKKKGSYLAIADGGKIEWLKNRHDPKVVLFPMMNNPSLANISNGR